MTKYVTLYSNDEKCRNVLYYLYHTNKDVTNANVLYNFRVSNYNKECDIELDNKALIYFTLGNGYHKLTYKENEILVTINTIVESTKNTNLILTQNHTTEIIKEITIEAKSFDILYELINDATKYVEELIKNLENSKKDKIKKYIYDPEGYWEFMNTSYCRNQNSLFLKENEKDKLIDYITSFYSKETKDEYIKFNMPYKCNILLYGIPGSGKTSTILTIASHIKTNIGVIPISKEITDAKLVHAFNNVKKNDCKIIVMEDIDCLFIDRKSNDTLKNSLTLSGILNCLDGLCRNEGILVFLTTNVISALDDALIRSSRIDYRIEYTNADEYQTKECFKFFFPTKSEEEFIKFYNKICYKKYTIAILQDFFFKCRKYSNIIEHLSEFDVILEANCSNNIDKKNTMYI
jgi:SpoVK/Ycf46/Vps4 family AAA+-type ATPase